MPLLPNKANQKLNSLFLGRRIRSKWIRDEQQLPLAPDHYKLYERIHRTYWSKFEDFPNLIDCPDFNTRIQWLKLFDQRPEMPSLADKVKARDFIIERIGEHYLPKLYQVHDRFSQIDFAALPQSFVIKANHDSGSVVLVRDKSKLDHRSTGRQIEQALNRAYGVKSAQWAYKLIDRKVFVEEFIDPHMVSSPPDYRFFCVDGTARFGQSVSDREANPKEAIVGPDGRPLPIHLSRKYRLDESFVKPDSWDEMKTLAEKLGKGFKFVRIDMSISESGRIYAGELTFWPQGGFFRDEGQKMLGAYLDFDRDSFRAPVSAG